MRPSRARPPQLNLSRETQPGLPRMLLTPKLQPRCLALSLGLLGQCPCLAFEPTPMCHPQPLLEAGWAPTPLAGQTGGRTSVAGARLQWVGNGC